MNRSARAREPRSMVTMAPPALFEVAIRPREVRMGWQARVVHSGDRGVGLELTCQRE